MCISRKKGAALAGAAGFALMALVMFTGDSASAFGKACTMAGGTQLGSVDYAAEDASVCVRRRVPGAPVAGLDSCHSVAKNILGCATVYTISGPPSACTMAGGTQLGNVFISTEDPSVCVRRRIFGSPPPGLDSCHSVAKSFLGCTTVYTTS